MPNVTAHHGLFKDTRLRVDDTGGPGRPVLLIHPWPLSGQAWSAQVPVLHAAGYRAVTYDLQGFGRSDKPLTGYTYDTLAEFLHTLIEALGLHDVGLVGSSMGGGEIARYISSYGADRVRSVVFASSVTPYMLHTGDNPDGPLTKEYTAKATAAFLKDQDAFYDQQMTEFFSANGKLRVSDDTRSQPIALCKQASKEASLACMAAWAGTDLRDDLTRVSVPALIIHGEGGRVGSLRRFRPTHARIDPRQRAAGDPRRAARVPDQPPRPIQRRSARLPGGASGEGVSRRRPGELKCERWKGARPCQTPRATRPSQMSNPKCMRHVRGLPQVKTTAPTLVRPAPTTHLTPAKRAPRHAVNAADTLYEKPYSSTAKPTNTTAVAVSARCRS